jgi:hypothetical protein
MSTENSSNRNGRFQENPWKQLRNKTVLVALLVLDVVFVAALVLSDGALQWLRNLPFLGEVMERVGPVLTAALLVQLLVVLVGYTTKLVLSSWQDLYDSHGGPKPSLGITVAAIAVVYIGVGVCLGVSLRNEKRVPDQTAEVVPQDSQEPQHLPVVFRLQRSTRGSVQSAQEFVLHARVTEIELWTPVAYASFKTFTLILDTQESQGYQVRNGELSLTVDRQLLPPGRHTLSVREKQKGSTRADMQTFEFTIIDALR